VADQAAMRISTGVLNDLLNEATAMVQPPSDKGKRLKIYYMTQSSVKPPSFVLFINNMELMHYSYERYLENQLRKSFGFEGTPIKFILRKKKRSDKIGLAGIEGGSGCFDRISFGQCEYFAYCREIFTVWM